MTSQVTPNADSVLNGTSTTPIQLRQVGVLSKQGELWDMRVAALRRGLIGDRPIYVIEAAQIDGSGS